MRANDEIDFVDDHEDDWKITESFGDYYEQDA
jgi:hypothetical protein